MKEKRYNILDWNENVVVGDLDQEQVQRFLDTYSTDYGHFLIEEIYEEESK
jgi:hypothetical protein